MSEDSRLFKIGGAVIILAAFGIMLPAVFAYVAGIGRMVILIVVALALAYALNLVMARQAINKLRKAKDEAAKGEDGAAAAHNGGENGNNGGGDGSHENTAETS